MKDEMINKLIQQVPIILCTMFICFSIFTLCLYEITEEIKKENSFAIFISYVLFFLTIPMMDYGNRIISSPIILKTVVGSYYLFLQLLFFIPLRQLRVPYCSSLLQQEYPETKKGELLLVFAFGERMLLTVCSILNMLLLLSVLQFVI